MMDIERERIAGRNTGEASSYNSHWLKRVRWGTCLLFWSILIPPVLVNSVGFLLPFAGGTVQTLRWVAVIYAISGVPILFGALAFSLSPATTQGSIPSQFLRRVLRMLAALEMLNRATYSLSQAMLGSAQAIYVWLPMELVGAAAVLIGSAYLRQLCQLLNFGKLQSLARTFLWTYGILFFTSTLWELELIEPPQSLAPLPSVALGVFGIFLFIWGLAMLSKFRTKLLAMLQGRCSNCGYNLTGLPERRCPECGVQFERGEEK